MNSIDFIEIIILTQSVHGLHPGDCPDEIEKTFGKLSLREFFRKRQGYYEYPLSGIQFYSHQKIIDSITIYLNPEESFAPPYFQSYSGRIKLETASVPLDLSKPILHEIELFFGLEINKAEDHEEIVLSHHNKMKKRGVDLDFTLDGWLKCITFYTYNERK